MRAFFALAAGFAIMALLIAITTAVLKKIAPSWAVARDRPSGGYIFINLGFSFLAAAAGGYVTAWLAEANPLVHILALAITVLVLGALSALQQRGHLPIWYLLTMVALMPLATLAGGLVRLRMIGIF